MRIFILSTAALALSASCALAAPASVKVQLSPELQARFDRTYGAREAETLTKDLRQSVEAALAKTGAYPDARIELTLTDAKPNRPTFKQLGDTPGLSLESFGVGGATIDGHVVASDGKMAPVSYRWYETDIRQAPSRAVWSDAMWTFDRFARKLARGGDVAGR